MSKRTPGFERIPNDLYRTWDERAIPPLLPFLPRHARFVEPCAGAGDLLDQLVARGHECVAAFDIDPKRPDIRRGDATRLRWGTKTGMFITNPPWTRDILHPIIKNLCRQAPTWLLFDSDWLYTKQSIPMLIYLRKVVAVGRLRWIPNSDADGKDNVSFYLFDGRSPPTTPEFYGRV